MSKISSLIFKDAPHYITSRFGWRTYQYNGESVTDFHKGTDYGTNLKKLPQYAIEDGNVLSAGKDSAGGIFAWINYPRLNVKMLHYHLNSVAVSTGQAVKRGSLIGYTGTTGQSTGIHLHLGIYDLINKCYVDPEVFASSYKDPEVAPAPTPDPIPALKYAVGNKVVFTGVLYADPDGNGAGQSRSKLNTEIQYTAPGKPMPYHITNLGWVKAEALSDYVAPAPIPQKVLSKGSTVKIIGTGNGSAWGNGKVAGGVGYVRVVKQIWYNKDGSLREFPYQVGNATGTTGFYKASALEVQ